MILDRHSTNLHPGFREAKHNSTLTFVSLVTSEEPMYLIIANNHPLCFFSEDTSNSKSPVTRYSSLILTQPQSQTRKVIFLAANGSSLIFKSIRDFSTEFQIISGKALPK